MGRETFLLDIRPPSCTVVPMLTETKPTAAPRLDPVHVDAMKRIAAGDAAGIKWRTIRELRAFGYLPQTGHVGDKLTIAGRARLEVL